MRPVNHVRPARPSRVGDRSAELTYSTRERQWQAADLSRNRRSRQNENDRLLVVAATLSAVGSYALLAAAVFAPRSLAPAGAAGIVSAIMFLAAAAAVLAYGEG